MSDKKLNKPQKAESKAQRFQKSSSNLNQLSSYEQEELEWTQDDRLAKFYNQSTTGLHDEIVSQGKTKSTNLKPSSMNTLSYEEPNYSESYSTSYTNPYGNSTPQPQTQQGPVPKGFFSSLKASISSSLSSTSSSSISTPALPAGPGPQTNSSFTDEDTVYLDTHGNPVGAEYDLGQDGAFTGYKIVIGTFIPVVMDKPITALKQKGFTVVETKDEASFCKELETSDVCWILSGTDPSSKPKAATSSGENYPAWKNMSKDHFVKSVMKFHADGGGLYIWGDNDPLFEHANALLPEIFDVFFSFIFYDF